MVSFPSRLLALRTGSENNSREREQEEERPAGVGGGCGVASCKEVIDL